MSASSGRDIITNGILADSLDGDGNKIINTDLTDSSNTFPSSASETAPLTTNALRGDGVGGLADSLLFIGSTGSGASLDIIEGKSLVVNNTLTLAGTDSSTLDVGAGGTLGTAAYTATGAYATAAQGASVDAIKALTGVLKAGSGTVSAATAKTDYWDGTVAVASGASHAKGLVPDPGASSGTTKFLREDMTYAVPPASSGVVIANTLLVIKGDNAGGGVAATPGSDYVVPSTALTRLTASSVALTTTTPAINWASTTVFTWTTSGNSTPTFSNDTDTWSVEIVVINGASHTMTWPAAVQWENGGTQPTQSVSGKKDYWGFKKVGSVIYGAVKPDMQ